ncbi:MAG: hypothetical protein HQK97_06085 [Nitrospirae bacterium]|nr:hypothetical protein [Nitrospirota bacterium]
MSPDELYDILYQTDHIVLSKIINGGAAFLNTNEQLLYKTLVKHADKIGWSHERLMWAMQRVMEQ